MQFIQDTIVSNAKNLSVTSNIYPSNSILTYYATSINISCVMPISFITMITFCQAVHSTLLLLHLLIEYSYVLSLTSISNLFIHPLEFHYSLFRASSLVEGIPVPNIVSLEASAIVLGLVVDNNFCSISFCWNFAYTPGHTASNPCSNHVSLSKFFYSASQHFSFKSISTI